MQINDQKNAMREEVVTINADLMIRVKADLQRRLESCIKEVGRLMPNRVKLNICLSVCNFKQLYVINNNLNEKINE